MSTFVVRSKGKTMRIFRAPLLASLFAVLSAVGSGQNLTGRWAAVNEMKLDNGETQRWILDLAEAGGELKGRILAMGYSLDVRGTVRGSHFEIYGWGQKTPFAVGEFANGELRGVQRGNPFVAKPATLADEPQPLPYIEPPALHNVPSNGLAKTPPMGWNSWNLFRNKIDDKTVREMADAMVSSGMRDLGYVYVNIDDTWEGLRDANGHLAPNAKFPDMKALADYIHARGLKLGIYSSPGPRTCAGYPGSYGHEADDAETFARWGIDYLKYDWCSAHYIYKNDVLRPVYQKMGEALEATKRPIVFSLCEYGMGGVEKWGAMAGGNLWRTTGDIQDNWTSMIGNIEKQVYTAPYAGPGHWNDPDMLEIGNGHMTDDEYRTHMSLWALSAAPLLAGNDLRNMTEQTKAILMNREVIAIDQDPLGIQATPRRSGNVETWVKPLADGSVAVGIVNLGSTSATATVLAGDLGLNGPVKSARNLWTHKKVEFKDGQFTESLSPHETLLLRVSAN
jgi:alpha-galactosidase